MPNEFPGHRLRLCHPHGVEFDLCTLLVREYECIGVPRSELNMLRVANQYVFTRKKKKAKTDSGWQYSEAGSPVYSPSSPPGAESKVAEEEDTEYQ